MPHYLVMTQGDDLGENLLLKQASEFRPALVHFFKRKAQNINEVDDLAQEVLLRIANRQSPSPVENLGGYVFQTAASVLADRQRRGRVRQAEAHVPFDIELHGDSDFDAERILGSRQILGIALAALDALPDRTRVVFILRRLEGHSYRDIAEQLGISVSGVEKHMAKATRQLLAATREQL